MNLQCKNTFQFHILKGLFVYQNFLFLWHDFQLRDWFYLPYTNVCIALHTQCFPSVCEKKNFTGDSGAIWTHDLLLTSADVLTSRPPSLPDDDWPASILYSSGFRDMYRLMKFLRRV